MERTAQELRVLLSDTLANLPGFTMRGIDAETAMTELSETAETIKPKPVPRLYQIETTSRCNLKCPFCPRTTDLVAHDVRDMSATMPLEKFCEVLDKMPWIQSLELFHFGEPFMHKDFEKYVWECKKRNIYTVVASNMLPATPTKLDAVFEAGLDFLVMDVDSLDADRYAKMRVGGTLDKLKPNVLFALKHPKRPYLIAQTILLDGKPEYTEEEFRAWSGGLMPDEVRYKFLDTFRGEAAPPGRLGPNDICREAFYGFTVHVNGNVVPCDRDWGGENVMGNIFQNTALEIWNGDKFKAFREEMKSPVKPKMCQQCEEGKLVNMRSQPLIQVNMFKGAKLYHK